MRMPRATCTGERRARTSSIPAIVLQLRDASEIVLRSLARASDAAEVLARRHGATVMPGRTWLQHATPVTFALKAAGWMSALDRVHAHLADALAGALVLQFGGASGTLAALGDRGPDVAAMLGAALRLAVPELPWHAHRDRLATLACALGVATGTMGKIARDIALLAQTEVAEAFESAAGGRGGSSTMPQKRNPVGGFGGARGGRTRAGARRDHAHRHAAGARARPRWLASRVGDAAGARASRGRSGDPRGEHARRARGRCEEDARRRRHDRRRLARRIDLDGAGDARGKGRGASHDHRGEQARDGRASSARRGAGIDARRDQASEHGRDRAPIERRAVSRRERGDGARGARASGARTQACG